MSSGELTLTTPITTSSQQYFVQHKTRRNVTTCLSAEEKNCFPFESDRFLSSFYFIHLGKCSMLQSKARFWFVETLFKSHLTRGFCCSLVTRQWRNEPRQAVSSPWCDQILSMLFYCYIQRWQHWYLFDVILPTSHLHNYTMFHSNLLWFHVAKLSPISRSSSVEMWSLVKSIQYTALYHC